MFCCIIKCPDLRLPRNVTLPWPCIFITSKLCVSFWSWSFSTVTVHLCGLLHKVSFVYFALPPSLSEYNASSNGIVKSCCLVYCLCYVFMFLLLFRTSPINLTFLFFVTQRPYHEARPDSTMNQAILYKCFTHNLLLAPSPKGTLSTHSKCNFTLSLPLKRNRFHFT